jgi:predicted transcriptional regulator
MQSALSATRRVVESLSEVRVRADLITRDQIHEEVQTLEEVMIDAAIAAIQIEEALNVEMPIEEGQINAVLNASGLIPSDANISAITVEIPKNISILLPEEMLSLKRCAREFLRKNFW